MPKKTKKSSKKPKATVTKPTTARQVLNIIDSFFCNTTIDIRQRHDLGNLLSAIRGPDGEGGIVKDKYTIPIRRIMFPKLAKKDATNNHLVDSLTSFVIEGTNELAVPGEEDTGHYYQHIDWALQAIERIHPDKIKAILNRN